MTRTAIVLFNLGGPHSPAAVRPLLFNLFHDPAIVGLPQPLRWLVATLISTRRTPAAQAVYAKMGGKSPLLAQTLAQASALERELAADSFRVFTCMRYWHPRARDVVREVQRWNPDEILLLPLYPQYSTATTGSSFAEWKKGCVRAGLDVPTRRVCCYFRDARFVRAHADAIRPVYDAATIHGNPRLLFSAHGLPQKIVDRGDPYPWQVGQTAQAVADRLAIPGLDWKVTYQSRVGPMAWIRPYTDESIAEAAAEGVPLVIVPIAFVSEHSETLVELDIEYRELAERHGCPHYARVPALGANADFIRALKELCLTNPLQACKSACVSRFARCGGKI